MLVDTGLVGFALAAGLGLALARALAPLLLKDALSAGLAAALLAGALHNLVDFNWQIPANAATFALLLGAGLARASLTPRGSRP